MYYTHCATPGIKIKYFISTKYPHKKYRRQFYDRQQSVQKHWTKLALSALGCKQ